MTDLNKFQSEFNLLMQNASNKKIITISLPLKNLNKFSTIITSALKPGDWLFLDGDLGSGKTAFTKELSICLGVLAYATSPTFSILNTEVIHPDKGNKNKHGDIKKFVHLDLYRLKSGRELFYLGLENEFNPRNTICVFEWPYNVDEEDFDNFFKMTKCAKPNRIIEIAIDIEENNINRVYSLKRLL